MGKPRRRNKKNQRVGSEPPGLHEFVIECKYTDKSSIKITQEFLLKLYEEAKQSGKKPYLIIGIPKDDKEMFILRCYLTTERKDK